VFQTLGSSSAHLLCNTSSGFVIVGEDNTGKLDLGIFIASIVPDGPADKDGRIRPGMDTGHQMQSTSYKLSGL